MNPKHKEFFQKLRQLCGDYNVCISQTSHHDDVIFDIGDGEFPDRMIYSTGVFSHYKIAVYDTRTGVEINFIEQDNDNTEK